ncbi:hypothetical protein LINGRAHAP2_LOCUS36962 [Linum grandiflorum]
MAIGFTVDGGEKKRSAYVKTLSLGRRSAEFVGDVFYGTDDAEGIEDYKYKEDVLEVYRREREKKSVKKMKKETGFASWFAAAIVDCLSFLKLFDCFRCI